MPARPARAGPLVLDRYRLLARLGAGACGVVWRARDERLGREVAVKAIPREATVAAVAADEEETAAAPERGRAAAHSPAEPRAGSSGRAAHEALAAARLQHPAIVTLYEAGEDADTCYLVSELVRGATLGELLRAGKLSDRDVVRIGVALCAALDHAHARDVVHRDIKPGNVLVPDAPATDDAVAKLTDFGVARILDGEGLTHTGDVIGTLAYMAPEQGDGRHATPAADLYSLALVLYEGLTGANPRRRATAAATARRLAEPLPSLGDARPELPRRLVGAIDRALDPFPDLRGSVPDLGRALRAAGPAVGDEPGVLDPPRRRRPRLPAWLPRVGAGVGAALLAALMLADGGQSVPPAVPLLAGAAGLLVACLPRLGWVALGLAAIIWLAVPPAELAGAALLILAGAAACPLLLPGDGRAWSVPALAPALGALGLATAYPALAGQASTWWRRAALGALGFWWLLLAEALLDRRLLYGTPAAVPPRSAWEGSVTEAVADVLVPIVTSGALLGALAWAVAATALPWLVRGRSAAFDIVGATAWCAFLVSATGVLGDALGTTVPRPDPRGALLGALLGTGLALGLGVLRRPGAAPPAPPVVP